MRVGTECGSHVVANRQHVNVLCALPLAKASAQCDCVTRRLAVVVVVLTTDGHLLSHHATTMLCHTFPTWP